ncbi:MAG: hypothetical protein GY749_30040 [Desulfobacteraceae bacterium]|nr:hypothetical protein [Desulfobacteraceae bacterium]
MNRKQQKTTDDSRLLISAKKRFVLNIKGVHGIDRACKKKKKIKGILHFVPKAVYTSGVPK